MKKIIAIAAAAVGVMGFAQASMAAGNLESKYSTQVSGWACDAGSPSYKGAILVVRDDNLFLGQGVANLNREPAVAAQCGGNAAHGFNLQLSDASPLFWDSNNHYVHVYYQSVNGQLVDVPGSPFCRIFGPVIGPSTGEC